MMKSQKPCIEILCESSVRLRCVVGEICEGFERTTRIFGPHQAARASHSSAGSIVNKSNVPRMSGCGLFCSLTVADRLNMAKETQ